MKKSKKRIVIALGGNALGNNPQEQLNLIRENAGALVKLIKDGHELVITHGNGPQVGMINLAFNSEEVPDMPFPECGAMSQGYIAYHLQNVLSSEFLNSGLKKSVAGVVTQVLVDEKDPAFEDPTKPIGSFYTRTEAEEIAKSHGYIFKEDAGRGYRRVVASPLPKDIVEKEIIKSLLNDGHLVIASGGGGIPVILEDKHYRGVAAVIDKDFAGSLLAEMVDADIFLILTAVDRVAINFNTPEEEYLDQLSVYEAKKYMAEGHFAKGSMLPKIQAAIRFTESRKDRISIITSLESCSAALAGRAGTLIRN